MSYSSGRSDAPLEAAAVVPLVDLLPFLDWPPPPFEEYSPEEFTHDIYQLHNSGVITTPNGARVLGRGLNRCNEWIRGRREGGGPWTTGHAIDGGGRTALSRSG